MLSVRLRMVPLAAILAALLFLAPTLAMGAAAPAPLARDPPTLAATAGCGADPIPAQLQRLGLVEFTNEPDAGSWTPWFVGPEDVAVPAPPATLSQQTFEELALMHQIQAGRTPNQTLAALSHDGVAGEEWTELFLHLLIVHADKNGAKNPPTLSRQIALLHTAIFDALVVAWNAKYCYDRLPPSMVDPAIQPIVDVPSAPSYPSEHAAAAGAAAVLMAYFFPPDEEPEGFDHMAREIADSRVWAGANYPSDVEAGLAIGYAVGNAIVAARDSDGWNAQWDGTGRITGTCNWEKTLPAFGGPLRPMWGHVTPFLMESGGQFRPPPPPACDGPDYLAQVRDLYETSRMLTDRQREIAIKWAGGQGTVTPPGQWINVALNKSAEHDLGTMRQARVMAHTGAAIADAAISAWDAKFTYWSDRPIHGIRRHIDPNWTPIISTPPFPGYTSGHSTFAGATTVTLAHFFPDDSVELSALATEAAMSRYYGGIHIRSDNEWGLWSGENIGHLAAARAAADGAE